MQELIAKIIAGEYNSPGTYSMFTLQVVKMLGKRAIFERICYLLIDNECLLENYLLGVNVEEFTQDIGIDFGSLANTTKSRLFLPNDMT